jgi:DNA repair exonuclease SbcCD ATPase subunit
MEAEERDIGTKTSDGVSLGKRSLHSYGYGPLLWLLTLLSVGAVGYLGWVLGKFYFQRAQMEETVHHLRKEEENIAGRVEDLRRKMGEQERVLEAARANQTEELHRLELAAGEAQSHYAGELRALQQRKEEIEVEERRLEEELARIGEGTKRRCDALQRELQQLEKRHADEVENFQKGIRLGQEQLQAVQTELAERQAEVAQRKAQMNILADCQEELAKANAELERQRETEKRLKNAIMEERQEAAALEAKIEELAQIGEGAKRRCDALQRELQQLEKRHADEVENFQKGIRLGQEQLQAVQTELAERQAEVAQRKAQMNILADRQEELAKANAELERQRETEKRLKNVIMEERQEAAALEAKIEELAQKCRKLSVDVIAEEANLRNAMRRQAEYTVTEEKLRAAQEALQQMEAEGRP